MDFRNWKNLGLKGGGSRRETFGSLGAAPFFLLEKISSQNWIISHEVKKNVQKESSKKRPKNKSSDIYNWNPTTSQLYDKYS